MEYWHDHSELAWKTQGIPLKLLLGMNRMELGIERDVCYCRSTRSIMYTMNA